MEKVKITSICDFQGGTQPPKSEWKSSPEKGYIRMLQIRDFTQSEKNYVEYVLEKSTTKKCKKDDILIGRYGASIGKICRGLEGAYNVALVKTIPNEEKLYKNFLYYILKSNDFQEFIKNIGSRAAQAGFNKEDLDNYRIPLPDINIQKKIVESLDKADEIRNYNKQIIEKYDALIQSLFLEMFGDPVKNEKGWKTITLLNACENIIGGGTPSKAVPEYYIGNIPWVTPKDMKFNYISDSIDHINNNALENSSAKLIPSGSVLMVIRSGILKHTLPLSINTKSLAINQDMKAFVPNKKITNVFFLKYYFQASSKFLLTKVRAVTADNIEFEQIKTLKFPLVPIELQNQFAERVQKIEAQKQLAQEALAKSEALFNSLLQQSFKS